MSEEPRFSISVADDRLTAFVAVRAGAAGSEEELRGALAGARVVSGIDEGALERLVRGFSDPAFEIAAEVIARGTAVTEGEHGWFEPLFVDGIQPGHTRDDGTLDFHDRELLKPVEKGDAIGHIHPAHEGSAGCLVDGTRVSAQEVKETGIALGPGVERDAEGVVRAARAGIVTYKASSAIDVVDHHVHKGSVDLHSGHLHMQGSLLVKGDVERSFRVYATGDVEIQGSVDSGFVHAGGSVRIKQGVRGGEGGRVCAEGDLAVHHAEMATLYAGGLLQIGDAVNARLAAQRVEASGKLRGGLTRAEVSVKAGEVGSPHGVDTELCVAEPFELPVDSARRALGRAKVLRVGKVGGPAERMRERGKAGKVVRAQAALQRTETERLAERAQRREMLSRDAFVQVGVAHPGVTLRIADQKLVIEQEIRASRFSLDVQTGEFRADRIGS